MKSNRNYLFPSLWATILSGLFFFLSCEKENPAEFAAVTTLSVTEVSSNTAKSGGNITSSGGADIISRGLVWGENASPTFEQHDGLTADGFGHGLFISNLSNLLPGTTYYVRSYAINSAGTAYGNEVQFRTLSELATLTTTNVTDISVTSAISGGNITSEGGSSVTVRGVCWSTSQNPTTDDNHTTDGSGPGAFTSNISGLSANTTYYLRAYATNIAGTTYGSEVYFTTQEEITGHCLLSNLYMLWEDICEDKVWSGEDIINVYYDDNGRLSKWEWEHPEHEEYWLFTYNSQGKIEVVEDYWDGKVGYYHFTWEDNKVTRQWSYDHEPSESKTTIEFSSNGEISRVEYYYFHNNEWILRRYITYSWLNGNLVKAEEYSDDSWKKSTSTERDKISIKPRHSIKNLREKEVPVLKSTNNIVLKSTWLLTYDDKDNPFSIHQALVLLDPDFYLFLSKNNVITAKRISGDKERTEINQWEYNPQNYPGKLILEGGDEDCYWTETIEFIYKNCD